MIKRHSREYLICQEVEDGVRETLNFLRDKTIAQKREIWADQIKLVQGDDNFHENNPTTSLEKQFQSQGVDINTTTFNRTMTARRVRLPSTIC